MEVILDKRWALDRLAEMLEEREEVPGEEVHQMLNTKTSESD
jgi:ATP-dependent Zn protease